MPYVHIRITDEGVTTEQKAELVARSTQMLVDVLGKNPSTTVVVIEEVPLENWGIGGELVSVRRERVSGMLPASPGSTVSTELPENSS
ncbi:4-oxalocrotonate tautomerase family protein [Deinococcus sp. Arct2-2]|uniref:tautomerase family protein n=1 Tax=Deinococcus sp. Arct2-2 TaxID=2568653 RepID=UPI0010A515F3|nr:4-oxalocrotonate tautomerase family protein [Deinococcus sp. Arct2-2]THF66025.1 4-oxalocrotonate tautomerase family protein [Deinococcus sp. Arct2-2]